MNKICLVILLITYVMHGTYNNNNPLLYNDLEKQYPSYVDNNHLGLCLKARTTLPPKTIIGTALMISTPFHYSHNHESNMYKHVSIMRIEGNHPLYGRAIGKYAFCNHSCEPNCRVTSNFLVETLRTVIQDEELTVPYDAYIGHIPWNKEWTFLCACKAITCRKVIYEYRTDIMHPAAHHYISIQNKK